MRFYWKTRLTIIEATTTCFKKYFVFSGRASRSEFWKFVLFLMLGSIICTILNSAIFGPSVEDIVRVSVDSSGNQTQSNSRLNQYNGGLIGSIFSLICLIPFLAAGWRRMHDIGRPGWLMLVTPILGLSITFALLFATSQSVPIDLSSLPEGTNFPAEMRVPQSAGAFIVGWLIGVLSFIVTIVFLAKKTVSGSNRFGPVPNKTL